MAKLDDINIRFEIEPVVKVICMNSQCYHNLARTRGVFCCNLKHIKLDGDGECCAILIMDHPDEQRTCDGIEGDGK